MVGGYGEICEKEDLCGDILTELGNREQKWVVALIYDQCELLNDGAKSELRTMLGFSENESSSNASDEDESSDQDNLSSINDRKDSGRNSDDGADDSDVTEQCQCLYCRGSIRQQQCRRHWPLLERIGMHSLL